MKLFGSTTSPYVRKVRVVMAEKKLEYQFEPTDVWAADTDIAATNPLGKVPTLQFLKSGDVIYDSRVIAEYLDALSPVGKLVPASSRDRLDVKVWEALADGVCNAGALARLEAVWNGRSEAERSQAWINRQLAKVQAGVAEMDRRLGDQPHCCGVHLTLADIAVGCTLGWLSFRFPQIDWRAEHPNLAQLQDKLEQRPSFAETMPG